ncbi:hypothetical protein [Bacillus sp. AFS017336]|uniref:hypothetical protein n=1 Tax=Bacillus sp. AFS017336 TaxID=2033489 RepID=UPI000BF02BB6|nr:hypothetical protein [Bacillus sp. AFS017336]PEL12693.1 hypothetical protein CN601_07030 [Bacillus sp. AFS017336]
MSIVSQEEFGSLKGKFSQLAFKKALLEEQLKDRDEEIRSLHNKLGYEAISLRSVTDENNRLKYENMMIQKQLIEISEYMVLLEQDKSSLVHGLKILIDGGRTC